MRKLQSVRDRLLASALGIPADKLLTFAERGTITACRGDGPRSFIVSYTAHLIVTDYSGDPDGLFWCLLDWVHSACPGKAPTDVFKFMVDVIDHKAADVSIQIDLDDVIKATTDDAGTTLTGQPDPDALAFDMTAFAPGLE